MAESERGRFFPTTPFTPTFGLFTPEVDAALNALRAAQAGKNEGAFEEAENRLSEITTKVQGIQDLPESEQVDATAKLLRDENLSSDAIGQILGVSNSVIENILNQNNFDRRGNPIKEEVVNLDEITTAGAINQAQDLDATKTFQDNVDFAVNNPAELTQEDYDKFDAQIGDIQRAPLNPEQKKAAISQVLTNAGIYHDVASLDILGKGSDAGGLLSKRIKIVPPDSSGGGGDSAANTANDAAEIVSDAMNKDPGTSVLDAAGISSASTVAQDNAGTMARTVNPFEGNTGGELIFDGTNFVQNIEVDGDEYSRLVPDILSRQLQEAIAAETDPQQKAALTAELAKYMEGTGNTVDTVNPMIVETYGVQTNIISPSQIANGSNVDWKEGDKISVLGLSDDKYLLEHISSTTNEVGNKSKTKDEQMDEQINNFLNGQLNWADIKIIAEQIYGAGTQQANNAIITASGELAKENEAKAKADLEAIGGQQAAGGAVVAGGVAGGGVAGGGVAAGGTGTATCGPGTKLAGQLIPSDGNCNPADEPLDPGKDPETGIGGGLGPGTGTGIGPGSGSGSGGGEGNSDLLTQLAQKTPFSTDAEIKIDRLTRYRTPLLERLFTS